MHENHESLTIEIRDTLSLIPFAQNSRLHSKEQINQIASSITAFGFVNPILIDENSNVIAGHGRLAAAKSLSLPTVPTITIAGLSDEKRRALVIADNKIAENANWDFEILRHELEVIDSLGIDLELTGFSILELANFFDSAPIEAEGEHDKPEPKPVCCPECGANFVPKKGKNYPKKGKNYPKKGKNRG